MVVIVNRNRPGWYSRIGETGELLLSQTGRVLLPRSRAQADGWQLDFHGAKGAFSLDETM
jgi:hypothetical protein